MALRSSRAPVLVIALAAGCFVQPAPATYATGPTSTTIGAPSGGPGGALAPAGIRSITFNGVAATERDLATLDGLEQQWGGRLPTGDYWYDNSTGAAGRWGGPMLGLLPAGLALGGALPANASGGGDGALTGVFINGRELHPYDVTRLQTLVGQVYQGRWFVDAAGNFGVEGGMVMGNLYTLAAQRSGGGGGGGGGDDHYYSRDQNGSAFVGGGCVSVTTSSGSYYGSGC